MMTPEQTLERLDQSAETLVQTKHTPAGQQVKLIYDWRARQYNLLIEPADHASERIVHPYSDPIAATAAFNAIGEPSVACLAPGYRFLGDMRERTGLQHSVFSIGTTAEAAIEAFAHMLVGEDGAREHAKDIDIEPVTDRPAFQWSARFKLASNGTGMKAAGIYVPGGAVLTWWS
ncbi:hypothetical protein CKO28_01010 [Rhodovibrio sodomensis]|uniref:Uncharacterized protein n=1 Tax=Rhodovibrio sodomensis TaxID=1088 RepID=A0ABS1D9H9_9PROT|nr:hypothetical protein [Rhodovibrio sodomensis]MBK1666622.1 hypothetical protein [Rhodovibrio sodomensis]